jgi:hypothetical protein
MTTLYEDVCMYVSLHISSVTLNISGQNELLTKVKEK